MQYSEKTNSYSLTTNNNSKDKIEIEIGDSKTPLEFYPQQKIMRWDNEVNVSVRLVHNEVTPVVSSNGDKIIWDGDKVKVEFYSFEGGQEFEVTLKEKPKSNIVQFTLVDKGVEYFYQPELTKQEIEKGAVRPDNVVGSYAVYTKENKINYIDGKEYKCGKVGHIYRPKIIDSLGKEVWGHLHIENTILSVIIPQDFLDKAVYPVKHAAGLTFGFTDVGATLGGLGNNYGNAFGPMAPASSGVTRSMQFYGARDSTTGVVTLGLHSDSTNYPGATVVDTSEISVNNDTPQWWTSDTVTASSITADVTYWAVIDSGSGGGGTYGIKIYWDSVSGKHRYYKAITYTAGQTNNPFPSSAGDLSGYRYSIYVVYSLSESASPSSSPSASPSESPSSSPSASPSESPSASPSASPSESPSSSLSASPSESPSASPSSSPSAGTEPSENIRIFTNKPGAVYDAGKTTIIFAEDMLLIKRWIEYLNSKI